MAITTPPGATSRAASRRHASTRIPRATTTSAPAMTSASAMASARPSSTRARARGIVRIASPRKLARRRRDSIRRSSRSGRAHPSTRPGNPAPLPTSTTRPAAGRCVTGARESTTCLRRSASGSRSPVRCTRRFQSDRRSRNRSRRAIASSPSSTPNLAALSVRSLVSPAVIRGHASGKRRLGASKRVRAPSPVTEAPAAQGATAGHGGRYGGIRSPTVQRSGRRPPADGISRSLR